MQVSPSGAPPRPASQPARKKVRVVVYSRLRLCGWLQTGAEPHQDSISTPSVVEKEREALHLTTGPSAQAFDDYRVLACQREMDALSPETA